MGRYGGVRAHDQPEPGLVTALAWVISWQRITQTGCYDTIDELAAAEKINSSYVSRLLRFTLLAPDIVEAILDGRQHVSLGLPQLLEPFPMEWVLQRKALAN
jgi:hypothetical protein